VVVWVGVHVRSRIPTPESHGWQESLGTDRWAAHGLLITAGACGKPRFKLALIASSMALQCADSRHGQRDLSHASSCCMPFTMSI